MKEELIPANGSRQLFLDIQQLIEEARISVRRAVNLRRMIQMATFFPDPTIVSTLSTQLSWSHFVELLSIEARERLARKKLLP